MLNLNSFMIGSEKPKELAGFYKKVLDLKPSWEDGEWTGFTIGAGMLAIGPHDKVKGKSTNPERIIFNFETNEVKEEFERMKKAGATVIAKPYTFGEEKGNMWIATLADPDGNYFQLNTPFK